MEITEQNLPMFLGLFAVVTIGFLIIFVAIGAKNCKLKKELLSNANNVEIKFDCPIIDAKKLLMNPAQTCYVVHLLAEEDAIVMGNSLFTELDFLSIEVEHYQLGFKKSTAKFMGKDIVEIDIEKNYTYQVSFNYIDKIFDVVKK